MALTSNQETLWNDIVSIYNNINSARAKFGVTKVSIPSHTAYQVPIKSAHVTDLKNALEDLRTDSYVGSNANTGITIPSVDELVTLTPFTTINSKATNIVNNVCRHDSSFRSSFRASFDGFSFDSSHRSSFDSSHRSSFNGSHDSFGWYSFSANQAF